jgi:hypothetical protein
MGRASTSLQAANDRKVGGDHYQTTTANCPHCGGVLQHWDFFARFPYLVGQVTKYVLRFQSKNGEEDLNKAEHFLQKLKEVYYPPKPDKS